MSLRSLSDSEFLTRIQHLVRRERRITLLVLDHLNELERRGLHLKLGYSSLFDYCTGPLGYSASAAVRRIKTARCLVRFPQLAQLLEINVVNLSTIAQISGILRDDNADDLLTRIRGKSQREVEAIVAEYQPGAMPRDRVRTIVVRVPAPSSCEVEMLRGMKPQEVAEPAEAEAAVPAGDCGALSAQPITINACEKSDYNRNGCESAPAPVHTETRTLLQFSVRPAFMNRLNRLKALAWHRLPANASLEQVFELALDLASDTIDPVKRNERRALKSQAETKKTKQAPRMSSAHSNRHIAASVRDSVFERDGSRCTFVGAGGHRCESRTALQVDHVVPVARGGPGRSENLRLLCAQHNRFEAERLMGRGRFAPS